MSSVVYGMYFLIFLALSFEYLRVEGIHFQEILRRLRRKFDTSRKPILTATFTSPPILPIKQEESDTLR